MSGALGGALLRSLVQFLQAQLPGLVPVVAHRVAQLLLLHTEEVHLLGDQVSVGGFHPRGFVPVAAQLKGGLDELEYLLLDAIG